MTDATVSLFRRANVTDPVEHPAVGEMLERIRTGRWRAAVDAVRNARDDDAKDAAKLRLPGCTFSGKFSSRRNSALVEHSGIVQLDFDDVDDVEDRKARLREDPHVLAVFITTSGNGLRLLAPVNPAPKDDAEHKQAFEAVRELFHEDDLDDATKDVARLSFVSHDPDIYVNADAEPVNVSYTAPAPVADRTKGAPGPDVVRELLTFIPKRPDYNEWVKIATAAYDGVGRDADVAEALLEEWSPEEKPGEYRNKLKHPLDRVTFGTLVHVAREHGYTGTMHRTGSLLSEDDEKKTQAEILLEISASADYFHTPDGDAYVSFPVRGGMQTGEVSGRAHTDWLRAGFHARADKPPAAQTLKNVTDLLAAKAKYEGEQILVHLRVAGNDGRIYIDLRNDDFDVVEIGPDGWRVTTDAPIKFRRTRGMSALPRPERGGSLELLVRHVRAGDDFILLLAWLIQSLRPRGPYPVLVFVGEQGTGKSTISRIIRNLIDPSTVPIRSQPREERDLVIAAFNGWMLAFDNLSGLRAWLSDALCRISTGGGFGTRKLYANNEEELFYELRPILLNGIEDIATRPDLADRAVVIELETIPDDERKTETEVWQAFDQDHPLILGALFDAVSTALSNIDGVELDTLPRMADFAQWAVAALSGRGFQEAYAGNRSRGIEQTINSDTVAAAVVSMLDEKDAWEGTTSELLQTLKVYLPNPEKPPKDYPSTVQAMTARLRRIVPALRAYGIDRTDNDRKAGTGARTFRLERSRNSTSHTSHTSQPANSGQKQGSDRDEPPDTHVTGTSRGSVDDDDVTSTTSHTSHPRHSENGLKGVKNGVCDKRDERDEVSREFSNDDWEAEMMERADEGSPF